MLEVVADKYEELFVHLDVPQCLNQLLDGTRGLQAKKLALYVHIGLLESACLLIVRFVNQTIYTEFIRSRILLVTW